MNPVRLDGSGCFSQAKRVAMVLLIFSWLGALAAMSTPAQQPQTSSYVGFNGQQVSAVQIAAGPKTDVGAMRKLVLLQPGTAFSPQALEKSVAALQQTHLFTEVQVSFEPDQNGLRVLFILQPADYVGLISFPGSGSRFAYAALLQAVDIPEQSPFVPDLLTQGQENLQQYLRTQGFFQAEVQPKIQRDEAHRIVNLVFQCDPREQARIGRIVFTGLTDQQASSLRSSLGSWWARLKRVSLKPGQKYSDQRPSKAIPYIRDHLREQNQLAPSIRFTAQNYDPTSNRVEVGLAVTPGPKVKVELSGAKLSAKTLRRLIPVFEEGTVDQDLIDEGSANLRSYFQSKGYFDVKIASHSTTANQMVDVLYDADLGLKHRVQGVYFDGNKYLSERELQARVSIKKGFLKLRRGKFNEALLKSSVDALTQLYKDQGFADVSIQPKVEDFEPEVDVTFDIVEGPQDRVATAQLVGNRGVPSPTLQRTYKAQIRPGAIFSQKSLNADRNQLLAAYLDLGYLNASVRSAASPSSTDPHKIDVTYTIEEGPQAHISSTLFLGQQHTQQKFINQATSAQIGAQQALSEGQFLQAETDLYDLGIFDWASVKPRRPVVNQTSEDVLVKVHESPLNSMDVGGGVEIIPRDGSIPVNSVAVPGLPPVSLGNKFKVSQKSYFGPRLSFDFTRRDLRGRAETATIGTILSRLDQRGFFTYADPHLHGTRWSSLLSISGERTTENPIYTAELGQASFQIERALDVKRTKQFIVRYSFQRTNLYNILIPNLVLAQDRHVRLSTFEGEYIRDTRDQPLDAHRGAYQTAVFGVTSKALGASADFVRFLGQSAFYVPVKSWLVWANNFRLGFAEPFSSSDVPLSERFFSGGADSLRGFPINGAGPQRPLPVCSNPANTSTCTLISVPLGGNTLFIFNSEARFPLPVKKGLGAVLFYDGGNVYANTNLRQFADDFTHSVGVGIRYRTPVGPVRLDLGYRLTPVPGVKTTQYFVTLGQSF